MDTPKRNEAVARWAIKADGTVCPHGSGKYVLHADYASDVAECRADIEERRQRHERTERDACMWASRAEAAEKRADALQGEVSRLREVMARVVNSFELLGEAKGVISNLEARRDCESSLIQLKEALNLEPPTDGQ